MPNILISAPVRAKLAAKHRVDPAEVRQCFANRTGGLLADLREEHQTNPATRWFIALTDRGRILKVCYVPAGDYHLRTCYPPSERELAIYRKYGRPTDL
jgi:hypothetical protein